MPPDRCAVRPVAAGLRHARAELDAHAKRLPAAQLVAVACVVAAPHRLSFDRPAADGRFGAMFDALAGFDLAYNQFPSLHIALAVILWGYTPARFAAWRAFCSTSGSC